MKKGICISLNKSLASLNRFVPSWHYDYLCSKIIE